MTGKKHSGPGGGGSSARGPREEHPAEARSETASAGSLSVDPAVADDLGAEYEFRGDVMEADLESARREATASLETAQRIQAEFDNYRKRVVRDQADLVNRAGQRIIEELLPILDNLERAIEHTVAGGELSHLLKGVEMVHQQVTDVFGKEGVTVIDPFGKQFDSSAHQAVGQQEDSQVPEGTVVDVYQKGYEMHGRVVRPAMVVVSTGGPPPKE
jgi:molecular chaperone GrpE